MRRFAVAATLAAALAPAAALDAFAASGIVTPRTYQLRCDLKSRNLIDVGNMTKQLIPRGTQITLTLVVNERGRRIGVRKAMTTRADLHPNQFHAFTNVTRNVESCSASVQLVPDYLRR